MQKKLQIYIVAHAINSTEFHDKSVADCHAGVILNSKTGFCGDIGMI